MSHDDFIYNCETVSIYDTVISDKKYFTGGWQVDTKLRYRVYGKQLKYKPFDNWSFKSSRLQMLVAVLFCPSKDTCRTMCSLYSRSIHESIWHHYSWPLPRIPHIPFIRRFIFSGGAMKVEIHWKVNPYWSLERDP